LALALPAAAACGALAALWPTAAVAVGVLALVLALCLRAPAAAFLAALALFSLEGTLKMRLTVEGMSSPAAVGAALLDVAFVVTLGALLLGDRGRSLRAVWRRVTGAERVVSCLLGAWLLISIPQVALGGDLIDGLEGLRLTQLYVPALLGGIVLAARLGEERLAFGLAAVIAFGAGYAALRGVIGPSVNEESFAEQRSFNTRFGELGRNVGSFTSPIALVSFLTPVALLSLVAGFLRPAWRKVSWTLFVLAMTGIIASYVRTALVAVIAGAALLAVMMLLARGEGRLRRAYALALALVVLGGGYGAALLAGQIVPEAEQRAESLANPFADESVELRLETWERSLKKVPDEPLGTGLGTVGRATSEGRRTAFTDSSYLKVLQEQGIPGGLVFLVGLGGLIVAVAVRLTRIGVERRPLGTASLIAFSGFMVLMTMGEFIEQPGKTLAWTLLGVAIWEAVGRDGRPQPGVDLGKLRAAVGDAVRRARGRVRGLPRHALIWLATCVLVLVALPVGLRLSSDTGYTSSVKLALGPAGGAPAPPDAAFWERVLNGLLGAPAFEQGIAERAGFVAGGELSEQLSGAVAERQGETVLAVTAKAETAKQARRLAGASRRALVVVANLRAGAILKAERRELRRELRAAALPGGREAELRRQIRTMERRFADSRRDAPQPTTPTVPASSRRLIDRLADAAAANPAVPPNAAWAGLAALILGLALVVAAAVVSRPRPPSRRGADATVR
jgi:O-antigen ligase